MKEQSAFHRAQTRKNDAVSKRNDTLIQARKIPSSQHRKERQEFLNSAYKNDGQVKEGTESRFHHRNASLVLPTHRNTSWPPTGKEHGARHQNASLILKWKEHSILNRNSTQAQGAKEPTFLHRNASQALATKEHRLLSMNISWEQSRQKQNIFQRNAKQAQANKRPGVTHRHVNQAFPGKGDGLLLHRNTTWIEVKKATLSQKNASQTVPKEKTRSSLGNAGQTLTKEKPSFPHRNPSRALPGKRNTSWTEDYNRPSHQNASWALPRKSSSSCRNLSQALAGTRHGTLPRCRGQKWARNTSGIPFRNTTQIEALKEKSSSHKNILRAGAGTPRWQPALPKDRDTPIMSSLPATCLLSEHAIACGNARLQQVPKLNDPGLKTLFLAGEFLKVYKVQGISIHMYAVLYVFPQCVPLKSSVKKFH